MPAHRSWIVSAFILLSVVASGPTLGETPDMSAAFKRGADLLKPYLVLSDASSADPKGPDARQQISEGVRVLTEVTNAQPENWSAFWLIGKGHQAVGNHAAAELAFKQAHAINPEHPDVARELMIESVCIGKLEQGVTVAKGAAELHPADAGLRANLGLAYLASGQLKESRQAVERALAMDPNDPVTKALLKEINAVQSGRALGHYCPP